MPLRSLLVAAALASAAHHAYATDGDGSDITSAAAGDMSASLAAQFPAIVDDHRLSTAGEAATADFDAAISNNSRTDTAPPPREPELPTAHALPPAHLTVATRDLDPSGPCARDARLFCAGVQPAYARTAHCLAREVRLQDSGQSNFEVQVSPGCRSALNVFMNANAQGNNGADDSELRALCAVDAAAMCEYATGRPLGRHVLACLRERKAALTSTACQEHVLQRQLAAAEDFREDWPLYDACRQDAERLCRHVDDGGGRVNQCLRENRRSVKPACDQELFRVDVEVADDLRLSWALHKTCRKETNLFCSTAKPFGGHLQDCLEGHRHNSGFGTECRRALEARMMEVARDWRLDAPLRAACMRDVHVACRFEQERSLLTALGGVTECLQDFRRELDSEACARRVHLTLMRAAADVRFAPAFHGSCRPDYHRFCRDVRPGSERIYRCLADLREQLSFNCQSTLFDHQVRMIESIDFQLPVKQACLPEIRANCSSSGQPVIRCLRQLIAKDGLGDSCNKEVHRLEQLMQADFRFNRPLADVCERDIFDLCADACDTFSGQPCKGTVLACLHAQYEAVRNTQCQLEVDFWAMSQIRAGMVPPAELAPAAAQQTSSRLASRDGANALGSAPASPQAKAAAHMIAAAAAAQRTRNESSAATAASKSSQGGFADTDGATAQDGVRAGRDALLRKGVDAASVPRKFALIDRQ